MRTLVSRIALHMKGQTRLDLLLGGSLSGRFGECHRLPTSMTPAAAAMHPASIATPVSSGHSAARCAVGGLQGEMISGGGVPPTLGGAQNRNRGAGRSRR